MISHCFRGLFLGVPGVPCSLIGCLDPNPKTQESWLLTESIGRGDAVWNLRFGIICPKVAGLEVIFPYFPYNKESKWAFWVLPIWHDVGGVWEPSQANQPQWWCLQCWAAWRSCILHAVFQPIFQRFLGIKKWAVIANPLGPLVDESYGRIIISKKISQIIQWGIPLGAHRA